MNIWQNVIDQRYSGDTEEFQKDFDLAVLEGHLYAISWDDLNKASNTLPHFAQKGRELIESRLGYLPHDCVTLPFEPRLRMHVRAYEYGLISEFEFEQQANTVLKEIRNQDMRLNTCLTYDPHIYRKYYDTFVPYGYAVRERLSNFLGYIPDLKHSVVAELWLRDLVGRDDIRLPDWPTPADFKAITLIRYREILFEQGQTGADLSQLLR
ncbi:hypothetical protein ACO2Q8_09145 [Larkinella sp. VNQ87]|uniref:hypothetical protein n=1 Tax=Larkinella sp. VNQ87 TaxID=3400921 RepID=UPI003C0B22B5